MAVTVLLQRVSSSKAFLSTAFLPPVEYFSALSRHSACVDACEHYSKQSYRNRACILTACGPESLIVPIVHDGHKLISEIRVDYTTPWLRRMKYAIDTAYLSSPFYEYYRDDFFALLDAKPEMLWEMNRRLTLWFCERIGVDAPEFGECKGEAEDLRTLIHPKKPAVYEVRPYWQVFSDKFGFTPNLSIVDLLFNEGPESVRYL